MLSGPELLVLQACRDLPGDQYGNVQDLDISKETRLPLVDVRAVLESLDGDRLVENVRLADDRYAAQITPKGVRVLSQRGHLFAEPRKNQSETRSPKVVPKGLRSFDAGDKDFFLELLPGPRRDDGLPESIHFWKTRIEETDPEMTFRVGYIFGPSGCGKSSLVKAGLLPRLSKSIISIYIEATAEETESRLARGLRKHKPELPADLDLRGALAAARESILEGSGKVLLVSQTESRSEFRRRRSLRSSARPPGARGIRTGLRSLARRSQGNDRVAERIPRSRDLAFSTAS